MWNEVLLSQFFPFETIEHILSIPPPSPEDGNDRLGWKASPDSSFTVDSAYHVIETPHGIPHDRAEYGIEMVYKGQKSSYGSLIIGC